MIYLTFDTCFFEMIKYDFNFVFFDVYDKSKYSFIISEIVDKEVRKHLIDNANSFKKMIKNPVFSLTKTYTLLKDVNYEKEFLDTYDAFLQKLNIKIIPLDKVNPGIVFQDYFQQKGVFSNSGKKNEFPDAFAVLSLYEYVKNNELYVISYDKDWINYFKDKNNVKLLCTKQEIISTLCREEAATKKAKEYLEKINITSIISDELHNRINDLEYYDSESWIDDSISDINLDETSITYDAFLVQQNNIEVYVYFNYDFDIYFNYDSYDEASYDKEDSMIYNVIPMEANVSGEESGFIRFSLEYYENNSYIKGHRIIDVDFCFWDNWKDYTINETPSEPIDTEW